MDRDLVKDWIRRTVREQHPIQNELLEKMAKDLGSACSPNSLRKYINQMGDITTFPVPQKHGQTRHEYYFKSDAIFKRMNAEVPSLDSIAISDEVLLNYLSEGARNYLKQLMDCMKITDTKKIIEACIYAVFDVADHISNQEKVEPQEIGDQLDTLQMIAVAMRKFTDDAEIPDPIDRCDTCPCFKSKKKPS